MHAIHSHTPGHIPNVVARGKRVQILIGMGPESASHSLSNHPEDVQGEVGLHAGGNSHCAFRKCDIRTSKQNLQDSSK